MLRTVLVVAGLLLVAFNGFVHGVWTQRWSGLTEAEVQAASDRLPNVPLKLASWDGHPVEIDAATLPEEMVGRNVTIRYVHRVSGHTVVVYLACGRPGALEVHTPLDCYPANGYNTVLRETRASIPGETGPPQAEFWTATFSQAQAPVPIHLRVFWSWKAAKGWQVPDNPGRAFRAAPFLYKCYAIRPLTTPEEPLEGDPCVDLLKELIPGMDEALAGGR